MSGPIQACARPASMTKTYMRVWLVRFCWLIILCVLDCGSMANLSLLIAF